MKVVTWNVNGIRAREAQVLELLDRESPDLVCLQEIKAPAAKVPAPLRELPGYHGCWHGESAYSGVALLVRADRVAAPPAFVHPPFDFETRAVAAEVGGVTVACLYVPERRQGLRRQAPLRHRARRLGGRGRRGGPAAAALRRPQHHRHRRRRAREGAPGRRHRPARRRAGAAGQAAGARAWSTWGGRSIPPTRRSSPGGRPGAGCGRRTSAGASTTWWRAARWPARPARCRVLAEFGTSDHAPVVSEFEGWGAWSGYNGGEKGRPWPSTTSRSPPPIASAAPSSPAATTSSGPAAPARRGGARRQRQRRPAVRPPHQLLVRRVRPPAGLPRPPGRAHPLQPRPLPHGLRRGERVRPAPPIQLPVRALHPVPGGAWSSGASRC